MIECELCKEEAVAVDYRPRKDLLDSKFQFTHTTPITCYTRTLVCNSCFHLSDKDFNNRLVKTKKQSA